MAAALLELGHRQAIADRVGHQLVGLGFERLPLRPRQPVGLTSQHVGMTDPRSPASRAPRAPGIFCIASARLVAWAASRSPNPALAAVFLGSLGRPCRCRVDDRVVTLANTPESQDCTLPISVLIASIASGGMPAI